MNVIVRSPRLCAFENVKPLETPCWPVVTIPPVPVDRPFAAKTVNPTEYDPAVGKVYEIVGDVVSIVGAFSTALNCQTYWATPPGAVEPVASKFNVRPCPLNTLNV